MSNIKTINPATGEVLKEYPEMTSEQLNNIVDKAHNSFKEWRKKSFAERAEVLFNVARLMRERKEELGKLCTIEMGKLHREGIAEVELCANIFEYYAKNGERLLADRPLETPHGEAFLSYEPKGVILSVQPWNFPFYQTTRSAAPNLIAGNTLVLKHASNVPQAGEMMEKLLLEAGAPEGIYNNIFVSGSKVSELLANPKIQGAALTGSEPAGASFASVAGKNIKKSILELGGSDAFIVLEDADLDKAVEAAVYGRLWNAGQVCVSPKRIIVAEKLYPSFLEKATQIFENIKVGDPLNPETELAPLSSVKSREEVLAQVEKAVEQGAKLVTGGKKIEGAGAFMQPTILTDIKKGMDAYSDEIFGPVLMIYSVKDIDEAVELANDTKYGLGGSIFSADEKKAVEVARRIETGMVYINHLTGISPELPFGGTKSSGYGREQSEEGLYEFVNSKLIRITTPDSAY